jgi:hypothetical protein
LFYPSQNSSIFFDKPSNGTIVSPFPFGGEETAGQLLHLPMIGNTLAAPSFSFTGLIGAGASGFVLFDMAFQFQLLSLLSFLAAPLLFEDWRASAEVDFSMEANLSITEAARRGTINS